MDDSNKLADRQHFAENLAEEAGELAKRFFLNPQDLEIESKNPRDFVSKADCLVEEMIRNRLAEEYPSDDIVGEEGGGAESDAYWCLDPIDGTSNFLAGIPFWGVSIGYCEKGMPCAGAICIPLLDILLSASTDVPGIRYNRSPKDDRRRSPIPTVVLGQSPYWDTDSFRQAEDIFRGADLECMNYRCSVIGTSFAALGWTHGYYEEYSNMWDVAAGFIIAQQAGLVSKIHRMEADQKLTFSALTSEIHHRIGSDLDLRIPIQKVQVPRA